MDFNKLMCKICNKEYSELNNFNWSCCTHRSEWGGSMWWCCGKQKVSAKGCKYQKHSICGDRDDEEEGVVSDPKRLKCPICKVKGHAADCCDKDPNIRMGFNIQQEGSRIACLDSTDSKKRLGDSVKTTSQFLTKTTLLGNERILCYDDYNYTSFNDKIFNLEMPINEISIEDSADEQSVDEKPSSDKVKLAKPKSQMRVFSE